MKSLVLAITTMVFILHSALNEEREVTISENYKINYKINQAKNIDGAYLIKDSKNKIYLRGKFNNGSRQGDWHFFDSQGNVTLRYNYDLKKLIYVNMNEFSDIKISINGNEPELDEGIPMPLCPINTYKEMLINELRKSIPLKDRQVEIEIEADIVALISTKGDVKYIATYSFNGVEYKKAIYPDNKFFKIEWIPAKQKSEFSTFVKFKILPSEHRRVIWNY